MEIIPAILPRDFEDLENKIELVKGLTPFVQVDICDGKFVPNSTWPYRKHDDNFDAILREDRGLPGWEDMNYEIDLMVAKPEDVIGNWIVAGASRIVVHTESIENLDAILKHSSELVEIGIAANITTEIGVLDERVKFIQCMGIRKIGFQGQEFDERVLTKIREIRAKHPSITISVDGGVNLETAELLRDAGADRLIVGSAIFESENIPETFHSFEEI